jgi:uncharacterized membrane protein YeaQ/YmgE (transglycosylase-associated protein family)
MSILWQLIVGLIIGAIARWLLPGKEMLAPGLLGWVITALIGMGGAFLGTLVGKGLFRRGENYAAGWIMSILGAILLLLFVRWLF